MDWIQFGLLLVAIVGVGITLKKDKKKDTETEVKDAVAHENRHTNVENDVKNVKESLVRVESKLDVLGRKFDDLIKNWI